MSKQITIRPRELDHVVLRVRDLESMLAFYREVLCCELERRDDEQGLWQLRAGASLIDLVPVAGRLGAKGGEAPGPEGHNMDHLCLRLADYDEAAIEAWLNAKGVAVGEKGSRYGAEGLGPSIYIEDPEGNTVELKGPPWTQSRLGDNRLPE